MNELIGIALVAVGSESVPTVNARELHEFLGNRDHFATWIKDRIKQYDFVEDRDFVSFSGVSEKGGRPSTEYALTLDMAKELCMVERNEKGKQARQYFIECERQARAAPRRDPIEVLNDPAAMRGLLLTYSEKVISLEAKVEEMRPDVLAFERIAKADGFLNITEAAKALGVPRNRLFKWLHANGWIYRRAGAKNWLGYDTRVRAGLLDHKATPIARPDGTDKICEQVVVTPKGLTKLAKEIGKPPPNLALAL